jgi:hypothetical protein
MDEDPNILRLKNELLRDVADHQGGPTPLEVARLLPQLSVEEAHNLWEAAFRIRRPWLETLPGVVGARSIELFSEGILMGLRIAAIARSERPLNPGRGPAE